MAAGARVRAVAAMAAVAAVAGAAWGGAVAPARVAEDLGKNAHSKDRNIDCRRDHPALEVYPADNCNFDLNIPSCSNFQTDKAHIRRNWSTSHMVAATVVVVVLAAVVVVATVAAGAKVEAARAAVARARAAVARARAAVARARAAAARARVAEDLGKIAHSKYQDSRRGRLDLTPPAR